ncbi:MAG: DUF721 domain-containing protein [Alphaproteobacteria bacterium]
MRDQKENRTKGLKPLGDMLSHIAKPILGKRGFVETDIIMRWQDIVGAELAKATRPQKISFPRGRRDGGVLHIMTNGGGEALLLQHRGKIVIEKINAFFGYKAIEKISIVQGFFDDSKTDSEENLKKISQEKSRDEDKLKIKNLTEGIADEKLAEVLEELSLSIIKKEH